jgi:RNA polymerase sigma-70 factor (ECF subfamily)
MHDPDTELVARAGRGDRAAAGALVARHSTRLYGLARRMLGNEADAEDVVQGTFLKLWTHAARWRPGAARIETWLYRVTLNACYDRLRRKRIAPLDEALELPDAAPVPATAWTSRRWRPRWRRRWRNCRSASGPPSCSAITKSAAISRRRRFWA